MSQLPDPAATGAARPDLRLVDEARHRLLDMISSGALRPGDKLGTERELAVALSVSRSTLRQVLAVLAQSGVVRRVPGRSGGTFVAHTSLVLDIVRIRLADGVPISLERVRLPADLVPGLLELPLGGSIYDLLDRHYGMNPQDVVEHLEVVEASPDEAALLGIADRAPLLAITRTSRTADGVAFEFSNDLFRADRTCVTFRTKAERAEIIGRAAAERPPQPGGAPVPRELGPGTRNAPGAPAVPAESGLRVFSASDRQGAQR